MQSFLHFNPRSPRGERPKRLALSVRPSLFQSTLPARGATRASGPCRRDRKFQSTLPARGATRWMIGPNGLTTISIHAPREGSDGADLAAKRINYDFNPRSPRGERPASACSRAETREFQSTLPARGATLILPASACCGQFQSTLPARGATLDWAGRGRDRSNFNPRSPRGERHHPLSLLSFIRIISIHAPREGSDRIGTGMSSTSYISIHAPREGSDVMADYIAQRIIISIHAPREGSDLLVWDDAGNLTFQSTLPARGATRSDTCSPRAPKFQSTLPARGATRNFRLRQFGL